MVDKQSPPQSPDEGDCLVFIHTMVLLSVAPTAFSAPGLISAPTPFIFPPLFPILVSICFYYEVVPDQRGTSSFSSLSQPTLHCLPLRLLLEEEEISFTSVSWPVSDSTLPTLGPLVILKK